MAASFRRNISFPAPRPSQPGARKRRQRITNQPSISSPTTAAAVIPRSSTAFGSQRSSEKHPSPQPLPRQIPIDDQALIALPRVRSSGAFGRRSPYPWSNARVGPASETLNESGHPLDENRVDCDRLLMHKAGLTVKFQSSWMDRHDRRTGHNVLDRQDRQRGVQLSEGGEVVEDRFDRGVDELIRLIAG